MHTHPGGILVPTIPNDVVKLVRTYTTDIVDENNEPNLGLIHYGTITAIAAKRTGLPYAHILSLQSPYNNNAAESVMRSLKTEIDYYRRTSSSDDELISIFDQFHFAAELLRATVGDNKEVLLETEIQSRIPFDYNLYIDWESLNDAGMSLNDLI